VSGQIVRVDLNLFCAGCGTPAARPNVVVSIRSTSGDLPVGADLGQAIVPGFSSGAANWYTANFSTPVSITAGTRYAIVVRAAAVMTSGVYAYIAAPAATPDTYPAGRRVTSGTSGATWVGQVRDINFKTYTTGAPPFTHDPAGLFVAAIQDSRPAPGFGAVWDTISWSATAPPGTALGFQVAGADSAAGPFEFVGPDGTSGTVFTSGASLAQFNGNRHLRYRTAFTTSDPSVTPVLHEVTTCVGTRDNTAPAIAGEAVDKPVLWAPNHKMVDILVSYSVADNFDPAPSIALSVASNEPVQGNGSGNTAPDWEIVNNHVVRVRAERSGQGAGRIYTITITATDADGNSSSKQVYVRVPHNQ
jgi:hypothetical protein